MKLKIVHSDYGCDSGCCGHRVETEPGDPRKFAFIWAHADGDTIEDKLKFVQEAEGGEGWLKDVDFEASDIWSYDRC